MDADDGTPDPFDLIDDIDEQVRDAEQTNHSPLRSPSTPGPVHRTVTPDQSDSGSKNDVLGPPPKPILSPTSSLSSLSPLWCTAVTSHSTQSQARTQTSPTPLQPKMSKFAPDTKYDEAMRKLDEQLDKTSDNESWLPATSSLDVKRESLPQFLPRARDDISPPPRGRRSKRFSLPPGTQVLELSSDSEPIYTENYADDAVDATYSPRPAGLPRGDGWVKKRGPRKARPSAI
ncbi:hypothetical protein SAMD00023353_5300150 [Rosellinia necatrix]|uniref:Uncharacterized protein n=1 Tax=Rosellinia necatrix TaxID=77044 RepID=A0A1S8AAA7_ROSNE|nr:hypothetical protein SAMD00023353_5300150 [Rosellinia necatrix]